MASIKKTNSAFEILKFYEGDNPYILKLKKYIYVDRSVDTLKDFQVDFILRNSNTSIKTINKIVKIADWWGEKKQSEWGLDFLPEKIKIISYIGDTETLYGCYIQYRKSVPPSLCFVPKNAVLTNFLVEDYEKLEVDFDRYSRLSNFKRILFDHQKTAVKFLLSRKKCILADDMGLGKSSAVSVAAIEGNFDSVVIICPASLKANWERELSIYVPERDITMIDGFADKTKGELEEFLGYAVGKSNMTRTELLAEAKEKGQWKDNRFIIVNYDILDKFFDSKRTYTQQQYDEVLERSPMLKYITNRKSLLIIDEAHALSNSKSNRYKAIKGLIKKGKPDSIYLVTGTPITNNPANFYCVLGLLDDPITSDWDYYMRRYCGAEEFCHPKDKEKRTRISNEFIRKHGASNWYGLTSEEKQELKELIKKNCRMVLAMKDPTNLDELKERVSHIYLRRTKDCLTLPKKTVREIYRELTPKQKAEYDKLWKEYEEEKKTLDPEKELNKDLLEGAIYRQYLSNEMIPHTIELTDRAIAKGEKVVIACCYDEELYRLQEYYGDRCVIYNGKLSLKQKEDAIAQFMGNPEVMVFIGNIKASSVGITLTVSRVLIFNDFDYVPGNNFQMSDRIHTLTHERPVFNIYQIFRHTQYEKMWDITMRKQIAIDTVIKTEDEK